MEQVSLALWHPGLHVGLIQVRPFSTQQLSPPELNKAPYLGW